MQTITAEFLDARGVAALLGIALTTVYKLTREGRLPHVRVGTRGYRYRRASLLAAEVKAKPQPRRGR
jgi:excisionase family DNA binding protein